MCSDVFSDVWVPQPGRVGRQPVVPVQGDPLVQGTGAKPDRSPSQPIHSLHGQDIGRDTGVMAVTDAVCPTQYGYIVGLAVEACWGSKYNGSIAITKGWAMYRTCSAVV